jgi:hypothetical protein
VEVADLHHHRAAEREINMRYTTTINIVFLIIAAFIIGGCYTQLMTPQDYIKVRKQQSSTSIANNAYSINYNQSCTSCHSVTELNERAEELEYYGIRTVHDGVLLSSRQWLNENPNPGEILYGDPGPVYWPTPVSPINPWWLPSPVVVIHGSEQNQGTTTTPKKKRADNPSRGNEGNTGREQPTPTYTSPAPVTPSNPHTTAIFTTAISATARNRIKR